MIGADPLFYLHTNLARWSAGKNTRWVDPAALAEYERSFSDPDMIHASCEDYRAAATIDLAHDAQSDAADVRIKVPLLALWGGRGVVGKMFDVLGSWREKSDAPVTGFALDCGHFLPEEAPDATLDALLDFF
jgi:haloacetate dehalogenase